MNLDDFSLDDNERKFFKEAISMIYEWLADDKRLKLNLELVSEGFSGIKDLSDKELFFRLLNFLEANYVTVKGWTNYILESLKNINSTVKDSNSKVYDVEVKLSSERSLKISEVARELSECDLEEFFVSILRKLGTEEQYKRYLAFQRAFRTNVQKTQLNLQFLARSRERPVFH